MSLTTIILINVGILLLVVLFYVIWNLLRKNEKLEDAIEQRDNYIQNISTIMSESDKKLKEISNINNIKYISKIDTLDFNFEKDFIVDGNFTFSDSDHWSEFGEIYFGKKLILNSIIILFIIYCKEIRIFKLKNKIS